MMNAPAPPREPTLGELFGDLARDTGTLVRQEVQLATTELSEKAKTAGKDAAVVAAGGVLAHAGMLALLAGVILAIATIMPLWAAALLVGALVTGAGAFIALRGVNGMKHIDPVPRATVRTIKENQLWVREQMR